VTESADHFVQMFLVQRLLHLQERFLGERLLCNRLHVGWKSQADAHGMAAETGFESYFMVVIRYAGAVHLVSEPGNIASEVTSLRQDSFRVVVVVDSFDELVTGRRQVVFVIQNVDFAEYVELVSGWESGLHHNSSTVWLYEFASWSVELILAEAFEFTISINTGTVVEARVAQALVLV